MKKRVIPYNKKMLPAKKFFHKTMLHGTRVARGRFELPSKAPKASILVH